MEDRKYIRYLAILVTATTLIRVWLAHSLGLGVDEAHYVQYALNPALSYYDHPPMVGYLIRLFIILIGKHTLAVRMPAILSGIGTAVLLFVLGKKLKNSAAGFWTVVIFNSIPLFSAIGGITVVPDTILSFFYLLSLLLLWRIYDTSNRGGLWYTIGAVTGLSLLTKYTAVLLYPSILLFIAITPSMRRWFRKKEFYLSLLLSIVIFLPVVIWNYENHWASFTFQFAHGMGEKSFFVLEEFLKNIGAQAGVYSPFIFIFIIYTLIHTVVMSVKKNAEYLLFFSFALPVILIFAYSGLSSEVLPHWPAVGYLILLPVLGKLICESSTGTGKKIVHRLSVFSLATGIALTLVIPVQALFRVIPLSPENDLTNEMTGWKEIAERIKEIQRQEKNSDFFVFTHTFYIASQAAFYLEPEIPVYCLSKKIDQYDFWQYKQALNEKLNGKNGLFFCDDNYKKSPEKLYAFGEIRQEKDFEIYIRGKHAKNFYIYKCYRFETGKTDPLILQSLPFAPRSFKMLLQRWNEKVFFLLNAAAGKNRLLDLFFTLVNWLGTSYVLIPVVGLFMWWKKRKKFRRYFWMFALSMLLGGIAVHFLKEIFSFPRPLAYLGKELVNVVGPPLKMGSFPSGHSQTVFTGVLFLAWLIPEYQVAFWTIGVLSGISRCYMGAHFPFDIFAGFVIALLFFFVVRLCFGEINVHRNSD